MNRNNSKSADRCEEIFLAMIRGDTGRRLTDEECHVRRVEINELFDHMDDRAIDQALGKLYRMAETDARRRARQLAHAVARNHQRTWLGLLFQKLWYSGRGRA